MCNFCRMEADGDIPDCREYLIEDDFDAEVKASIVFNDDGKCELISSVPYRLMLEVYKDSITATLFTMDEDQTTYVFSNKINYCPMCGRKL